MYIHKPFIALFLNSIQIHFTQKKHLQQQHLLTVIVLQFNLDPYVVRLWNVCLFLKALSSWWWSTSPSSHPLTWWRSTAITWERPGWSGTWRASHWCPRICRSQRHISLNMYPFPGGCSAWFASHFW